MSTKQNLITGAWVAAGLVCVGMMHYHASLDEHGAVSRGGGAPIRRRLAGDDNEYEGSMRSIGYIWNLTSATSGNGMSGPAQLIISTALVLVLGSLAAGAGIGGGGLFVPIYMVLLGAGPKGAVPLSKATILGGAVGNFMSIGPARHPKANRPMIDYESSTLMQSGELLGVIFGVLLNNLLPAVLIVGFLVLILSYNAYKTLNKAFAIRKKEDKAFAKAKEEEAKKAGAAAGETVDATPKCPKQADAAPAATEPEADATQAEDVTVDTSTVEYAKPYDASANGKEEKPSSSNGAAAAEEGTAGEAKPMSDALKKIYEVDAKQWPLWAWALLIPMTAYTTAYSALRKVIQTSEGCTAGGYWTWYMTPVPILGGFMIGTAWILGKRHKAKVAAGFPYLPADMQWDGATLRRFPFTALLAGVTAGLLGIGGGMVIGPLFLSIGMEPQVGTSSCAFMILWTAFSGVVVYGIDNHLGAELALWCVGFGFVSGQIGQRLVNTVLKKTGRPSYVVFLLGSIIGAACIAMATTLVIKMAQGDYDANDVVEVNETVATHLFYLGTGFGCKNSQ